MNIAIIGAGAFGTALATVLEENHHTVTYFDPRKYPNVTQDQALASAEVILVTVPNSAIADVAPSINARPQPIIIATKGLLSLEDFAAHPVSLLSGPAFAKDIRAKQPITLTATSPLIRSLLETPWLNIELTPDTIGVMLCGSLKNVYALGSGLLANPPRYVDRALAELKTYLKRHKASPSTADLACGIGDLTLTCTDPQSRNFSFGLAFRKNPAATPTTTVEGLTTLASLPDYKKYPILNAIHGVFSGDSEALEDLVELTK